MKLRYNSCREAFGEGRLNWPADDIVAYLLANEYRPKATDRFTKELTGVIAGPEPLRGRSIADGYAKADPALFRRVKDDRDASAVVIARRDSVLIAFSDEIDEFPMKLNGGDILVKFEPFLFRI